MGGRRRNRKRTRASASEWEGQAIASEGGAILEAKKAWMEAQAEEGSFSLLRRKPASAEAKPAVTGKKRKKVVKTRLPDSAIKGMMAWPDHIADDIPDDELAKHPKSFHDVYHQSKNTTEKILAYHQALIDQYEIRGYVEDETEVTDDDEEVVEN